MPYPPPPGPAELGIFQAIGLVPELPPLIGNYYLTNSAGLTVWSPVGGGTLPDMTGHAGEFLSTDGSIAFWAPTADILPDQTGHGGEFLSTNGTIPNWTPVYGIGTSAYDIRLYGAIANDPTFDSIDAIEAAIAAWVRSGAPPPVASVKGAGGVYFPQGDWYVSRPILVPQACTLWGDGPELSVIHVGVGTPSTPANTQGFGGPLMYIIMPMLPSIPNNRQYPDYGAPLVGATGQSMVLKARAIDPTYVRLCASDSFPWSLWLQYYADQLSFRCWVQWSDPYTLGPAGIFASVGPLVKQRQNEPGNFGPNLSVADVSVGLFRYGYGGNTYLRVYLTTYDDGQIYLDSNPVVEDTPYHCELDYDGANVYFYVDGVLQSSVAASGIVKRLPWESVLFGDIGAEYQGSFLESINGFIDSLELASVPYHTGANFTPPAAKHTWGANTLWLCNFDQGQALNGDQPFVLAQTTVTTGATGWQGKQVLPGITPPAYGGPNLHYMRGVPNGGDIGNISSDSTIRDVALACNLSAAGIITWGGWRSVVDHVFINAAVNYGIKFYDPLSFFATIQNCYIGSVAGMGIQYIGSFCLNNKTIGCAIAVWVNGGCHGHQDQPAWNSFIPFCIGDPLMGGFQFNYISDCQNDEEGNYTFIPQKAPVFVMGGGGGPTVFQNNSWIGNALVSPTSPIIYWSVPEAGAIHIGDSFWKNDDGVTPYIVRENINYANASPTSPVTDGHITLLNCSFNSISARQNGPLTHAPIGPISNKEGWVTVIDSEGANNQRGLSSSEALTNNLAGTVYILAGFTSGSVTFDKPEISADFLLQFTLKGYSGSAPAAGSTTVSGYTTSTTGFTVTVGADPGGTCQLELSWVLIGAPAPLYFEYSPTLPETLSPNPLVAASPTGDFAVGMTLIPAGTNALPWSVTSQVIAEAGTASTNWWQAQFIQGTFFGTLGSVGIASQAFVLNGRLHSILSPGAHNVAIAWKNGIGWAYVDGGAVAFESPGSTVQPDPGTQQTPLTLGEHAGGTDSLVDATIRNFKLAKNVQQVITDEPDSGPEGQPESAFIGDDFTVGYGATTGGGAATQIATARYGTKYYWIAAKNSAVAASGLGDISLPDVFWKPWGSERPLENLCFSAGFFDVAGGVTAVDAMAGIQNVMEGGQAYAFWGPTAEPLLDTMAHIVSQSQVAWCIVRPPFNNNSGTATLTVNSVLLNFPFITDNKTTVDTMVSLCNSTPAISAVLTASAQLTQDLPGGFWYVVFVANAVGSAGNGITIVSDNLNNSATYPTPYTQGAIDLYIHIDGNAVLANWAGSTAATLTAVTGATNGTPAIAALGTATDTGSQMKFVLTARGAAGNAILVDSEPQGPQVGWVDQNNAPTLHLANGYNGALSSVSGTIVLCNVPPFGTSGFYSPAHEAERLALNAAIAAYVVANPTITLGDLDTTLWDPGNHTNMNPAYLYIDGWHLNDAGYTAMFGLLNPLLP